MYPNRRNTWTSYPLKEFVNAYILTVFISFYPTLLYRYTSYDHTNILLLIKQKQIRFISTTNSNILTKSHCKTDLKTDGDIDSTAKTRRDSTRTEAEGWEELGETGGEVDPGSLFGHDYAGTNTAERHSSRLELLHGRAQTLGTQLHHTCNQQTCTWSTTCILESH